MTWGAGVGSGDEGLGRIGRGQVALAVADGTIHVVLAVLAQLPVGDDLRRLFPMAFHAILSDQGTGQESEDRRKQKKLAFHSAHPFSGI
jgi:hypothetical protein